MVEALQRVHLDFGLFDTEVWTFLSVIWGARKRCRKIPVEMMSKKIDVAAYAGYKGDERPLLFVLDHQKLIVEDVMDRWYGQENDYFKVLASDGRVYLLKRHRNADLWYLAKVTERPGKH